jgi:hypothetical protein
MKQVHYPSKRMEDLCVRWQTMSTCILENGKELLHSKLINLEVLRKVRFHLPAKQLSASQKSMMLLLLHEMCKFDNL